MTHDPLPTSAATETRGVTEPMPPADSLLLPTVGDVWCWEPFDPLLDIP